MSEDINQPLSKQGASQQEENVENTQMTANSLGGNANGSEFQSTLLEQYKLYVEMMDRVTMRRLQISSVYVSLLSGLLGLLSITSSKELFIGSQQIVLLSISILGVLLCVLWNVNVRSYKQLNFLKFKVIHEMENYLPFPCYTREWQILKKDNESRNKYFRLTKIEQYIPLVMSIPYLCLFMYVVASSLRYQGILPHDRAF